jgi:HEAT repeat protein
MTLTPRRILLVAIGLVTAAGLALSQNPPAQQAAPEEADTTATDLKTLREVGLPGNGEALLEYFRKQTAPAADPKRIEALIHQLGDDDFNTREDAFASLAAAGAAATPTLKQFETSTDTELRKRVLDLKRRIEVKAVPAVQSAAARIIARSKPAGAAEVLLAFLPFAMDSTVVDECARTLGSVAMVNGKVEPVLLQALSDTTAVKRGAAAEALVRAKVEEQLPAVRGLLKDADPHVRLRTALALVSRREKDVVPILIDLLADLSPDQLWPVEEVLIRLAGDKAPPIGLGTNETTRKAARDAWQKWYVDARDKIDLARLESPDVMLGYTVLVHQTPNRVVGGKFRGVIYEVIEIKNDKTPRWKFEVQTQVVDAQVVGENRVLLAEFQTQQVTERDFKGNIIWKQQVGGNPISVQRLPNGNTFVVKNNGMAEYNRKGDEVYTFVHQQFNIFRGQKLRNGEVAYIVNQGQGIFTRMDNKNNVLKTFPVSPIQSIFGSMDVLSNGNVLVPDWQRQRIAEFDKDGKEVKSINNVQWPLSVHRLPNGHTLVTTQNPGRVIEFNAQGTEVMTYQADGQVFNARRR